MCLFVWACSTLGRQSKFWLLKMKMHVKWNSIIWNNDIFNFPGSHWGQNDQHPQQIMKHVVLFVYVDLEKSQRNLKKKKTIQENWSPWILKNPPYSVIIFLFLKLIGVWICLLSGLAQLNWFMHAAKFFTLYLPLLNRLLKYICTEL